MNTQELKDKVNLSMTKDAVREFGDLRLKSTWQAAYDSLQVTISQPDVVQEQPSAELIDGTTVSSTWVGTVGYICGCLWVVAVCTWMCVVSVSQMSLTISNLYYTYYKRSIHKSLTSDTMTSLLRTVYRYMASTTNTTVPN